jgi:isopentenyl diphosphate isomerase/L-lactate dehydrogenase-like FMN-dependent dehydrogenase
MTMPPAGYSREIYHDGVGGSRPPFTTDLTALEAAAAAGWAPEPLGYVAGGAGSGSTDRANRAAFERWRLVPRQLTGSAVRDLSTRVLGTRLAAPVITAPVGGQSIVHPDAEAAVAAVSAELGLAMTLSTLSSLPLEQVAAANGAGARWFQLYWPGDEQVCLSLLRRARDAGYSVLVLTVDTWMLAWRPRDLDNGYLPFLTGEGLANYFTDPAFLASLARPPAEDLPAALARWLEIFSGHDHTWADLAFLRENWDGPIVLKGIQHPDDARRAVDAGMQGVVVSNHGGRQVDGAIASLDALPAIVDAVGAEIEVLFDSGVRTGSDILKALALGAKAVLIGRPWVYGLGLGGVDGVRHVLRSLLADFDLSLALTGHRAPADLSRGDLVADPAP